MATSDDLGFREAGAEPYRPDYGPPGDPVSLAAYHADWRYWRAVRMDAISTRAEHEVKFRVFQERLGLAGEGSDDLDHPAAGGERSDTYE